MSASLTPATTLLCVWMLRNARLNSLTSQSRQLRLARGMAAATRSCRQQLFNRQPSVMMTMMMMMTSDSTLHLHRFAGHSSLLTI
eukprot:2967462-Prymnesium_polylepis.1